MPSPDVAQYLGLDLVQLDEVTLIEQALAQLVNQFPDWEPRPGNTEYVLLEAIAGMLVELGYTINALPDGITEILLRLFGLERDQGAPPTIAARFNLSDTVGHTIPAGTTVRLDLGEDTDPVDFTTLDDLVVPPGQSFGTVTADASAATVEVNGVPAGTQLEVLDALRWIDSVVLAEGAYGGRDPEDGTAFLNRAIPVLSRLTTTLVRPADIEAYVAERPGVTRVKVLDLYNPATPAVRPGNAPGFVTVAVAGPSGSPLPSTSKSALLSELINRTHAGLKIDVVDVDVSTVDVTIEVLRFGSAVSADVEANVRAAIRAYLNPDVWAWSSTVFRNELIAVADRAAGVDVVVDVTVPAANVNLTGWAPLAKVGTITVTVTAP
jgi:hypothetical protein